MFSSMIPETLIKIDIKSELKMLLLKNYKKCFKKTSAN